jgi:hypothetical protein
MLMARLAHTNMLGLDREHAHVCSRMLTYANIQGLDREHALMLTGALPSLMLNHLQVQHTSVYIEHTSAYV